MNPADVCTTVGTPVVPRWIAGREVELPRCFVAVDGGPDRGKRFGPLGEQTTLGREGCCEIGLTDPQVSKQHCELAWCEGRLRLRDLASMNGIWLAGTRVYDIELTAPARFRIGTTDLRLEQEDGTHTRRSPALDPTHTLVGACPAMHRLFDTISRVGPRNIPVLLLGETGTGKTAIAQAIHRLSPRPERAFVAVNCAALPADVVESTLFGHVRGAFTGAHRDTAGLFEQARGGTVLLDEVGDLPLSMQAKLLSVLESARVRPVGSERELPVDFRLISATNRKLVQDVRAARFRQDLYFRIAGIELTAPALRDRMSDLRMLAEWLVLRVGNSVRAGGARCDVTMISDAALEVLEQHPWPGNVRELEYVIARAVALCESHTIEPEDILLTPIVGDDDAPSTAPAVPQEGVLPYKDAKAALVDAHDRTYFEHLFAHTGGNQRRGAMLSGLSRTRVREMWRKYGLGWDSV